MKMITRRGIALWIVVIAFVICCVIMSCNLFNNADEWVMKRMNHHIYTNGELVGAGTIYDSNGKVLVKTSKGNRKYSKDSETRKSTLHVVGDKKNFISTGIQSVYAAKLTGYTLPFGTYDLDHGDIGNDITLTIDRNICNVAYEALGNRKGTVGVVNYKTGDIICSVSTPTYDPENVPSDILTNDRYEGVYINRLLSAHYVPGSTFKVVTAICAIENWGDDAFKKTWECNGKFKPKKGVKITCWGHHDELTLKEAFAQSCNPVFAQIAIELGSKKLQATAKRLGIGKPIMLSGNVDSFGGHFDVSKAPDDALGWTGVGQGDTRLAPITMLKIVSAIANGGSAPTFNIVEDITNSKGVSLYSKTTGSETLMDSEVAKGIGKLMRNNGKNMYDDVVDRSLKVCAKTGTAQIDDIDEHNIAWFVGYMKDSEYPYAFVVVVENGNSGHRTAAPIAQKVLKAIKKAY